MEADNGESQSHQAAAQDYGRRGGRRNYPRVPYPPEAAYFGMPFPNYDRPRDPNAVYRIPTPCWYPPPPEPFGGPGPDFYYPPYPYQGGGGGGGYQGGGGGYQGGGGGHQGGRGRGRRGGYQNYNRRDNQQQERPQHQHQQHQQQPQQHQQPEIGRSEGDFPPLGATATEDSQLSLTTSRPPISRPTRSNAAAPAISPAPASTSSPAPASSEPRKSGPMSWSNRVGGKPLEPAAKSAEVSKKGEDKPKAQEKKDVAPVGTSTEVEPVEKHAETDGPVTTAADVPKTDVQPAQEVKEGDEGWQSTSRRKGGKGKAKKSKK